MTTLSDTATHNIQTASELLSKTEQLLYFRLAFAAVGVALCLIFWFFSPGVFDLYALGGSCAMVLAYASITLGLVLTKTISKRKDLNNANALLIGFDVLTLTLIVDRKSVV